MTEITTYSKAPEQRNKQDELQRLAKQIFTYGKIEEVIHHNYSTNDPEQTKNSGKEFVNVCNGSACYVVGCEGMPVKFYIQMRGFIVTCITELVER